MREDTSVVGVPFRVVSLYASPEELIRRVQFMVGVSGSIAVKIVVSVDWLVMPPFPIPFMEEMITLVGGILIVKLEVVWLLFPAVSFAYTVMLLGPANAMRVVLAQPGRGTVAPPFREYQQLSKFKSVAV